MNSPDHRELWRDALTDATPDSVVEATLASTLARARRVRRARYALRVAASATVMIVAGMIGVLLLTSSPVMPVSTERHSQGEAPMGIPVRYITDEELLARFPNQPVGLVGSGSSREFVVFSDTLSSDPP